MSVTLLAVGSCGADPSSGGGEGATREVETSLGSVEIPAEPQRVVSLNILEPLQVLDELGASLVGTQTRGEGEAGVWDELSDEAQGLESVWIRGQDIDLEAIVQLEPDLIVGSGEEDLYEQLSAIAPTTLIDPDGEWPVRMRAFADVVNRGEQAEELLADVEARLVELEEAIDERWPEGVEITLLRFTDGISSRNVADRQDRSPFWVINEIEAITVTGDLREESGLSPEQLREADADVILYYGGGGGNASAGEDQDLLLNAIDNPLWDGLSAVEAGRAHAVDSDLWWGGASALAAQLAIDDLFQYVAEAP